MEASKMQDLETSRAWHGLQWERIRARLKSFLQLNVNWNSYGATPINSTSCNVAEAVISALEERGADAEAINISADSDILLYCSLGSNEMVWQIELDGDISVRIQKPGEATAFYDIQPSDLKRFVDEIGC